MQLHPERDTGREGGGHRRETGESQRGKMVEMERRGQKDGSQVGDGERGQEKISHWF